MIGLVLNENRVIDLKSPNKKGVIGELVNVLAESGIITKPKDLNKALMDREAILSTGIGLGIAVPHARLQTIKKIVMAFGRHAKGVPFNSIDGKPAKLIFLIVGSDSAQRSYLKLLARIVQVVKRPKLQERLLKAKDTDQMYDILKAY